ncbi:hypothetical protein D515_01978 [Grimontia indica]|uniref:Uncharacterized protein n=1 Tax=Grimontia indica TaxID=1056512 RepID=R1GTB7_9GAMM|nr:hypothetical protein [Grimontia indica]EOD79314.1 hypothetical protein D515_01978 [Grimontia indica]
MSKKVSVAKLKLKVQQCSEEAKQASETTSAAQAAVKHAVEKLHAAEKSESRTGKKTERGEKGFKSRPIAGSCPKAGFKKIRD